MPEWRIRVNIVNLIPFKGPYLVESKWGDDFYILRELSGGILELPIHG